MAKSGHQVDTVVIGAGAVGLACAMSQAQTGAEVLVLEAAGGIGTVTSSRNSEVIHAGLYYPTGSLKHLLCVRGRRLLYPFLEAHAVAHKRCGKLIVATDAAEEGQIEAIFARGTANDVEDLHLLEGAQARALEPALACVAAIHSGQTGIFDSHGFMLALQGRLEAAGGMVVLRTPVVRAGLEPGGGFWLETGGEAPFALTCRHLVNAAGLWAPAVAARIEGLDPLAIPRQTLAKGSYFACAQASPFQRLIYPAPVSGGLGVHVTLDLHGRMRFGPDVEWLDQNDPAAVDYRVDIARADGFYDVVRRYWPGLRQGAITPDYAGCRPKLSGPGEPAADFRIDGPEVHGFDGLVNLFGIESPGLTSALAIADYCRKLLK